MQSERGTDRNYEDMPLQYNLNKVHPFQNQVKSDNNDNDNEDFMSRAAPVLGMHKQRQVYTQNHTVKSSAVAQREQSPDGYKQTTLSADDPYVNSESTPVAYPVYNNFTVGGTLSNAQNTELLRGLEAGILNIHSNLKQLEGKYIDLANFYK